MEEEKKVVLETWLDHLPAGSLKELIENHTRIEKIQVKTGKGTIRVYKISPKEPTQMVPMCFIAGFASSIEDWRWVIEGVTRKRTIYYVETREKDSSTYTKRDSFELNELVSDIDSVIKKLGLKKYYLAGSSLGASMGLIHAAKGKNKPKKMILLNPRPAYKFSRIVIIATFLPSYFLRAIRHIISWVVPNIILRKGDIEQKRKAIRNVYRSDLGKVAKLVNRLNGFKITPVLRYVPGEVLIIGASKDGGHGALDAEEIAARISNAKYMDIGTNARAHEYEMVNIIDNFFD